MISREQCIYNSSVYYGSLFITDSVNFKAKTLGEWAKFCYTIDCKYLNSNLDCFEWEAYLGFKCFWKIYSIYNQNISVSFVRLKDTPFKLCFYTV